MPTPCAPSFVRTGRGHDFGDPGSQTILGTDLHAEVSKLLVEAATPMALDYPGAPGVTS